MTDHKTDDTGKGPSRPGEAPHRPPGRPHATIDLKATEVGSGRGADGRQAGTPDAGEKPRGNPRLPPPGSGTPRRPRTWTAAFTTALTGWAAKLAGALLATGAWVGTRTVTLARRSTFLSHMAAGVAGAGLTLAAGALAGLIAARGGDVASDTAQRLAALEKTLAQRSATVPAMPVDPGPRLAATDRRLTALEERAGAMAALERAQAKLAADTDALRMALKTLKTRVAAPELTERVAKLETALAAVSAEGTSGGAAVAKGLDATLAKVEKLSDEAGAAVAATARIERDLVALRSEAADLRQSLETLKGSVDDRVLAKVSAFERQLQALRKTENARTDDARRVLLTLELASLKRALDRGDSYMKELAAVRTTADGTVDLAPLERSSATGVPSLGALTRSFRKMANEAVDAENARPDPSVLDRLVAGARSIVRVRKAHYDAGDTSVEATLFRMETALKDGNVGEVLAQAKRLPPKAAAAAEGWVRRLEARYAADRTIARLEEALKASLTGGPDAETDAEPGR